MSAALSPRLSPRGGGPSGRKPRALKPLMPALVPNEEGLLTLSFELPAKQQQKMPPAAAVASPVPEVPPPRPDPAPSPTPSDPAFAFVCGEGVEDFVRAFKASAQTDKHPPFGYFREESLADIAPGRACLRVLPNPFRLRMLRRPATDGHADRYLTVSPVGGVTLWVDGHATEAYPVDEWRAAMCSVMRASQ